jgi:stage V sporulation protein G
MVEITDVKVRRITKESKMKAIVSITIDDSIAIHEIKVIQGTDKLFISMPNKKTPAGEFKDICHPINSETRQYVESVILKSYDEAISELNARSGEETAD